MIFIFIIGIIITKTRNNVFTVLAALLTLVVAQYGVQIISIIKYKDGDSKVAKTLSELPNNYVVWNSALLGDNIGMTFLEHIIITDKEIVCILDSMDKNYQANVKSMERIAQNKGITQSIVFIQKGGKGFNEFLEKSQSHEINDLKKQEEFIELLKSASI